MSKFLPQMNTARPELSRMGMNTT